MHSFPIIFDSPAQAAVSGPQYVRGTSLADAIGRATELAVIHRTTVNYTATSQLYGFDVTGLSARCKAS